MGTNNQLEVALARLKASIEKRTVNTNKVAEADPRHEVVENSVTKSHALSRAYYRFGLVEKRCMEAMISKLNPLRKDNVQEIELRAVDYAKTFGVNEKIAYRDLHDSVYTLMRRVITADRPSGKGKVEFTLMSKAEYIDDEGRIVCVFNPLIVPYLMGLKAKFSSYPLQNAVDFSSSYAWRFYELLVSWAKPKADTGGIFAGWFTVSVDELRQMLGVPESYPWNMFQTRVLDVAQKELQEKIKIHMNIIRKKSSRKITHLIIEFIEDTQMAIELEEKKEEKPKRRKKDSA